MQIYELTQPDKLEIPLVEGLWTTLQGAFSDDPKLAGMSLKQKSQYMATNNVVDQIAEKIVECMECVCCTTHQSRSKLCQ